MTGPVLWGVGGYARRLLHLLTPDMAVLWDKGFDGNDFLAAVTATGAQVLGRLRSNRRTPVLLRLADGSYLSAIGTLRVRIIDARITVTCADGTVFTGAYRLVTTLTDARRFPAGALVGLYHQRWEHESAYYALRHTIMGGRVLRSGDRADVEQEMWSLLTLYQLLRTVMVDAAESLPGTDPDRCGFTIAFQTARDQVVQAAGIITDRAVPVGVIGRRVLAGLLPPRRTRVSTRKVKSPISRYNERLQDGRPDASRTVTDLDIRPRTPRRGSPTAHGVPGRPTRQPVRTTPGTSPGPPRHSPRHWHTREIARHPGDITLATMHKQLARWSQSGLLRKSGPATYTTSKERTNSLA